MRNVIRLFISDVKHLGTNVITAITIAGLVLLPSLFSWYNILACWDVFGNTSHLTVAVANSDEGYVSDLVPIRINIGEEVVSALRANDQMDWVIVDEQTAIDGARSGRYYAAVVIPQSFSRDMMSFFSDDVEHAQIKYYTNEKKNAIAPKVTDQGVDRIANQVNRTFTEVLTESALAIVTALYDYAEDAGLDSRIGELANHIIVMGGQLHDTSIMFESYAQLLDAASSLANDTAAMLSDTLATTSNITASLGDVGQSVETINDTLDNAVSSLDEAIAQSIDGYDAVIDSIEAAFDNSASLAQSSSARLRNQAASARTQANDYAAISDTLTALRPSLPENQQAMLDATLAYLDSAIKLQNQLANSLEEAASSLDTAAQDSAAKKEQAIELAQQAKEQLENAHDSYNADVKPLLQELNDSLATTLAKLTAITDTLDAASMHTTQSGQISAQGLSQAAATLRENANKLDTYAQRFEQLGNTFVDAVSTHDLETFRTMIGSDPAVFATALAQPVQLERHAIYPVENFGSAMAPLYTTLALWIGALLTMVMLKVIPSKRTLEAIGDMAPWQVFLGRFGIISLVTFLQSTCLAVGNLVFLGVQAVHPFLYLICFWVAGLVFSFIIYTLVALFANLGKALAVLLLIVQVSGGGGSFPMQLLPEAFQAASPYLPISHAVNAMRAAMFGMYQGDFWIQLGILVLFAVPLLIAGIALHGPLNRIVPQFMERTERSGLM